jgi:molybdopterin-guanine dinucleotide biosynthesis protein A
MKYGGIVLCGGKSSRMGTSKAHLQFGAETLLQRIVRIMGEVLEPVVVVAAKGQILPELPAGVIVCTDKNDGQGPLEGLAAGLEAIKDLCDAVFLSSCDVPFLKKQFILGLTEALGESRMCIPRTDGYFHPLASVYRIDVLSDVKQLLGEKKLRPFFLLEKVKGKIIEEPQLKQFDPELFSLKNLNTPEEFQQALSEFQNAQS